MGKCYILIFLLSLKEHTNSNKNIKRESKLYSYKEQMEEIELKKVWNFYFIDNLKRKKINALDYHFYLFWGVVQSKLSKL